MRHFLWLLILMPSLALADAPPFKSDSPAQESLFLDIYNQMGSHIHDADGSSRLCQNFVVDESCNVAMGTTTIANSLHIVSPDGTDTGGSIVTIHNEDVSPGQGNVLRIRGGQTASDQLLAISTGPDSTDILLMTGNGLMHIQPVGAADVQLEVSDGTTQGAGTIHASTIATHSSRDLKSDIRLLNSAEIQQGYDDVKSLQPVTFRYKRLNRRTGRLNIDRSIQMTTGLIFEDAPASIKTEHKAISLNARVLNLEMAVIKLIEKVEALEGAP